MTMQSNMSPTDETIDLEIYDPDNRKQLAGCYKSDARLYTEKTPQEIARQMLGKYDQETIIEWPSDSIVTVTRSHWWERNATNGHFERAVIGRFTLGQILGEDGISEGNPHMSEAFDILCRLVQNGEPIPAEIVVPLEDDNELTWKTVGLLEAVKQHIAASA
jgi:hypothetical protein